MPDNNDQNNDKFPGYPHYSPKEDIMSSKNVERVDLNVEDISRSKGVTTNLSGTPAMPAQENQEVETETETDGEELTEEKEIDETDITEEDLLALEGDESILSSTETVAGGDLDVPGTEVDDANEEIGEEDEENNYYSLGGDAHENLAEDQGSDS